MRRRTIGSVLAVGVVTLTATVVAASGSSVRHAPGESLPRAMSERIDTARTTDERCRVLERQARSAIDAGRGAGAENVVAQLIACREASPFLGSPAAEIAGDWSLPDESLEFLHRVASELVARAHALEALRLWSNGRKTEAERTLGEDGARLRAFARLLGERAARAFDAQRWREAARAFGVARGYRLRGNAETWDGETVRMAFNEAVAELNGGHAVAARALLEEIRRYNPDEMADDVARALDGAMLAEIAVVYQPIERAATAAFRAGDWAVAIAGLQRAETFLVDHGLTATHPRVAALRHNRALAHRNAGDPARAHALLVELGRTAPDYEPQRVRREIDELAAQIAGEDG